MVVGQPRGQGQDLAANFEHAGVADAYRFRPPYPAEVFDVLEGLIEDEPAHVLDLGAGEGALARPLVMRGRVERIDAVDSSAAMVAAGRERPGGGHPALRWIVGSVEDVELHGPYALMTAGASPHWMAWRHTLPRLRAALSEHGVLAVVEHGYHRLPWRDELNEVILRHSRSPGFDPRYSVVADLSGRGAFKTVGEWRSVSAPFGQSVADYIEQFHSTASLARELMAPEEATEFDETVARIVHPYAQDDVLTMSVEASVVWGLPAG